jgi:hypothetical protein
MINIKQERRDIPTVWQSTVIFEDGSQWKERHESDLVTRWHNKGFGYDEINTKRYSDSVYGENLKLSELKHSKMLWIKSKNPDAKFSITWQKIDY